MHSEVIYLFLSASVMACF